MFSLWACGVALWDRYQGDYSSSDPNRYVISMAVVDLYILWAIDKFIF